MIIGVVGAFKILLAQLLEVISGKIKGSEANLVNSHKHFYVLSVIIYGVYFNRFSFRAPNMNKSKKYVSGFWQQ